MTTYLPSPNVAVTPSEKPAQTVRIAAFHCEGLACLARELGFRVAVVAAVDDVARHAQRLHDTWYASGVPKSWDDWALPFDFDNWLFRSWSPVPLTPRDLPAIATVALATLGRLAGASSAAAPTVGGL